jgi:hypothetical protein
VTTVEIDLAEMLNRETLGWIATDARDLAALWILRFELR